MVCAPQRLLKYCSVNTTLLLGLPNLPRRRRSEEDLVDTDLAREVSQTFS